MERKPQLSENVCAGQFPRDPQAEPPAVGSRIEFNGFYLITNADQGALFSWQVVKQCYPDDWIQTDPNCPRGGENHLTLAIGGGALDNVIDPAVPNQSGPFAPILQLEDGSSAGTPNDYLFRHPLLFPLAKHVIILIERARRTQSAWCNNPARLGIQS